MKRFMVLAVMFLAFSAMSVGCTCTGAPRFYTLSTLRRTPSQDEAEEDVANVVILLGPISLPKYLDRPEIVTRHWMTELRFSERNRWAEPLEAAFSRVLARDLAMRLPYDQVILSGESRWQPPDFQVVIEVTRFDGVFWAEKADVRLEARWSVRSMRRGRDVVLPGRPAWRVVVEEGGYRALTTAMSLAVDAFSGDIAEAINGLRQESAEESADDEADTP